MLSLVPSFDYIFWYHWGVYNGKDFRKNDLKDEEKKIAVFLSGIHDGNGSFFYSIHSVGREPTKYFIAYFDIVKFLFWLSSSSSSHFICLHISR